MRSFFHAVLGGLRGCKSEVRSPKSEVRSSKASLIGPGPQRAFRSLGTGIGASVTEAAQALFGLRTSDFGLRISLLTLALSLATATASPTLFMIGDSTMANKPVIPANSERGWGQMFQVYFKDGLRVENHALNGRSSKSFRDEGRWQPVLDHLRPGDFVIIQFGHNDEKSQDPKRYAAPFGDYQTNLVRYLKEVRARQAQPILATPIARRSFDSAGVLQDTHGDYPAAVRQVAAAESVPLLDLTQRSTELLKQLGPERSKQLFNWVEPGDFARLQKGLQDNTHLNAFGATRVCDLAVEEIKIAAPALAAWFEVGK